MLIQHTQLGSSDRRLASRPCHRNSLSSHRLGRQRTVRVAARLTAKGKVISADQIAVRKSLGEGSYGQVFEGIVSTNLGEEERVVLKRTKARVEGAAEMAQMEHIINVYASKAAKGSIAEFLGYCEVSAREANYRLTEGLWLMWRYEGQNTLAYYLRRRDTLRCLARDLDCPEDIVVPVAMRHLLLGLSALHNAGLVHRDVKPLNIIFSERDGRLKLIDLGAAADLRTGTNYSPEESILDPMYCPPEQYVLPTDSPHLAKSAFALALSPVLWAQHKPDRFDSWSAGIVLLQLALPGLRQQRGINLFKSEYERADYDIYEWKENCRWLSKRDTAVLDANDGAGWELAQALLRPRSIRVDNDGKISFVSLAGFTRIGAQEALKHPFLRPAAEFEKAQAQALRRSLFSGFSSASSVDELDERPVRSGSGGSNSREARKAALAANGKSGSGGSSPRGSASKSGSGGLAKTGGSWWGGSKSRSGSGSSKDSDESADEQETAAAAAAAAANSGSVFNAAAGLWRGLQDKLFDLEGRMIKTASRTAKQTARVDQLEAKVSKGQADAAALARAKNKLGQMQQQLDTLDAEKQKTASRASSLLSFLGIGGSSKQQPPQPPPQPEPAKPSSSSRSGWQGLISKSRGSAPPAPAAAAAGSKSKSGTPAGSGSKSSAGSSSSGSGSRSVLFQAWESLGQQLQKLEGQLSEQQSKTEKHKLSVQNLQQKVKAGEASSTELQQAQEKLGQMSSQLEGLQANYNKVKSQAAGLFQRIKSAASSPSSTTTEPEAKSNTTSKSETKSSTTSGPETKGSASSRPETRGSTTSKPGSKSSTTTEPETKGTSGSSSSSSSAAVKGLGGAFYAGLKFSSFAMKIAGDVVTNVKDDANRFLKEREQEAEAKRAARAAEATFLQLLRGYTPNGITAVSRAGSPAPGAAGGSDLEIVISEKTTYAEVQNALEEQDAWKAVPSDSRRREMFAAYIEALRQVAADRAVRAEKQLTELLIKLNVGPESEWTEVAEVLAVHPLSSAIPPERRGELFDARVREVVLQRACQAAAERADNDFRQLLQERSDAGKINVAFTTWTTAKPVLWSDIRYQSLPENRRLELFTEFMGVLQQQAAAKAVESVSSSSSRAESPAAAAAVVPEELAPSPPPAAAAGAGVSGTPAGSIFSSMEDSVDFADLSGFTSADEESTMSPEDLAQLQLLRWEQAKLRADYMKMEAKLRVMENKIRSGASSPIAGGPAEAEEDASGSSSSGSSNGTGAFSDSDQQQHQQEDDVSLASAIQDESRAIAAEIETPNAQGSSPAAAAAASDEDVPVAVSGGEGDVSVTFDDKGVMVFNFGESESVSAAASHSTSSSSSSRTE